MKAWVLHDIGNISYEETDKPLPREGEVLIAVKAAGICGSDIPRIYETGAHKMPIIPGHEFSGLVEAVGEGVSTVLLGRRVAVCPKIPCNSCSSCRSGRPNSCSAYDYIGSRRNGAFAEYVTAPARNLSELPENVSFEHAALMEPLAVAVNAVRTGVMGNINLKDDSPIAVWGLGPIGLMVIMLLFDAGFRNITAIGKREGQKKRALDTGIAPEKYIDGGDQKLSAKLAGLSGTGFSLVFECVGRSECISGGIDCLASEGMLVSVGNPYSDILLPRDIYWKLLRRQLTVKGIWNSVFYEEKTIYGPINDWNYAMQKLDQGIIAPGRLISHRLPFGKLDTGLEIMREKTEDHCKIIISREA